MARTVRIGNAHGFWGDDLDAAAQMLRLEPDLDYLTLDFLAEVSMSILAVQRQRDPAAGFARDFVDIVASLAPYWRSGGTCRVITSAGGLNPAGCAHACRKVLDAAACSDRTIAVVSGDNVLDSLRTASAEQSRFFRNLDTGEPLASIIDRLATANVYLGAQPMVEALDRGADLVITGRTADPSLTVAACMHHFGWERDDYDRLAGATVAGHLIECGAQVTGGISTDWLSVPDVDRIGFPIVEVADDGACVVTKPRGSGGWVTTSTVKEQLVYEIGDPNNYISPDAIVSFMSLNVEQQELNRVHVSGAKGRPAPDTLKVSATWRNGYRAVGHLTLFGTDALPKARRAADAVMNRLQHSGVTFRESVVEFVGSGACGPAETGRSHNPAICETVLRIAVADDSRESVERFVRALMPLITSGPPGTTGYAEGRPRVHPLFGFWPCLIERSRVQPDVRLLANRVAGSSPRSVREVASDLNGGPKPQTTQRDSAVSSETPASLAPPRIVADIACARSGDKGKHANIGVIARKPDNYDRLRVELTSERVAVHLGLNDAARVQRFELPNLHAINFVIHGILDNPLRLDAQGKALGQVLLQMPLTADADGE